MPLLLLHQRRLSSVSSSCRELQLDSSTAGCKAGREWEGTAKPASSLTWLREGEAVEEREVFRW